MWYYISALVGSTKVGYYLEKLQTDNTQIEIGNPGARFTEDLRIILRQFSYLRSS